MDCNLGRDLIVSFACVLSKCVLKQSCIQHHSGRYNAGWNDYRESDACVKRMAVPHKRDVFCYWRIRCPFVHVDLYDLVIHAFFKSRVGFFVYFLKNFIVTKEKIDILDIHGLYRTVL